MSKFEQNWFWWWKDWSVIDHWWCLVSALCMIWIHVRFCFIRGGKLFQQWRLASKKFIACMFGRYADLFPGREKPYLSWTMPLENILWMNIFITLIIKYPASSEASWIFTWRVWKKNTPEDEQTICTCKYMHICAVWKFRLNLHIPHSINVIYSYWLSVKATFRFVEDTNVAEIREQHFCLKVQQIICCPNPRQQLFYDIFH